nr:hypothetical protein [Tanacetum cinerariifolium]
PDKVEATHTGNTFASVVKGNLVSPMSSSPAFKFSISPSMIQTYHVPTRINHLHTIIPTISQSRVALSLLRLQDSPGFSYDVPAGTTAGFIRVDDLDRLINNLCTLWVGRFHLQANAVRYERSPKSFSSARPPNVKVQSSVKVNVIPSSNCHFPSSFVAVVNDKQGFPALNSIDPLALVLDDDCVIKEDLSRSVLGKVKVLSSVSDKSKNKLLLHKGVLSWFDVLKAATNDFVSSEQIVWVDIEGIPLYLWSNATFSKISKKWGDVVDIEECVGSSLACKRICVKTSRADNILETFKVVFKGRIFLARAKELFTWTPSFWSIRNRITIQQTIRFLEIIIIWQIFYMVMMSDDPFRLNDLLDKPPISRVNELDPSLSHSPGFTPDPSQQVHRDSSPVQHNVNPVESLHEEFSCFLVSDGIILGFPAILAVCLDLYLSDHRPILLNEIYTDFGPTPFRTFHSWFSREGFDA